MTTGNQPQDDPRREGPQPPFPEQQQQLPGSEQQMRPRPDHGEDSYRGNGRLEGTVALVTGADSGIGKAVAIAFAREGADVAVSYLSEHEDARETERLVREAGRRVLLLPGDISDEQHCNELVRRTMQELGRLDILVNNAAHQLRYASIEELPSEDWDYTFRTNIYAMFYLTRAAWPHLQPGSTVINTTSIQAYKPSANLLAYATTKGAIVTFTKALAQQGIEAGIRVNGVAPGPVWTPLIPASTPAKETSEFGQQSPEGRPAQPAELAPAYVFLACTADSSFVNGEILGVHGGVPLAT